MALLDFGLALKFQEMLLSALIGQPGALVHIARAASAGAPAAPELRHSG